jgi:hypothetical protein
MADPPITRTVTVFFNGSLIRSYPLLHEGAYIGGPLTTDEEYARAAKLRVVEERLLTAEQAARADYMVEGTITQPGEP